MPRVWIAHDIGQALNPTLVRGQVEGSVYMALGEALMEEQAFRRLPPRLSHALVHKFPSMLEYKSPTTLDMPEVFTELVENPDPRGPFGAKEAGQGPLLPVMPAVANAVYDAIGVRIDEVPITPEKIVKALQAKAAGKDPRYGPARFPDIAWPEPLQVPPPWEGGDGKAIKPEGAATAGRAPRSGAPDRRPSPGKRAPASCGHRSSAPPRVRRAHKRADDLLPRPSRGCPPRARSGTAGWRRFATPRPRRRRRARRRAWPGCPPRRGRWRGTTSAGPG